MDDEVRKLMEASNEGEESGEFKAIGVSWKMSQTTMTILMEKGEFFFLGLIVEILVRFIYQYRQFKKPFPNVGSWAFRWIEWQSSRAKCGTIKPDDKLDIG